MTAGHNTLRGSGPDQTTALTMLRPKWVVLIAGSTGSALRAVRALCLVEPLHYTYRHWQSPIEPMVTA